MFELMALLVCALLVGGVAVSAWRARILFELDFRHGKLFGARGRLPPTLLDDILDIMPGVQEERLVIRCVVEQDHARVITRGTLAPGTLQQLRNVVGVWPLARLRTTPLLRVSARSR
jgi:hypothetical protein